MTTVGLTHHGRFIIDGQIMSLLAALPPPIYCEQRLAHPNYPSSHHPMMLILLLASGRKVVILFAQH